MKNTNKQSGANKGFRLVMKPRTKLTIQSEKKNLYELGKPKNGQYLRYRHGFYELGLETLKR